MENCEETQAVVQSEKKKWTFGRILKTTVVGGLAVYGLVCLAKTEAGKKVVNATVKPVVKGVKGLFSSKTTTPEVPVTTLKVEERIYGEPRRENVPYHKEYRDNRNNNVKH